MKKRTLGESLFFMLILSDIFRVVASQFSSYTLEEKIWACYTHSYIRYVSNFYMTNRTLRERFGIEEKNSSMISRLLKETSQAELIKKTEDSSSDKNRKYVPFWA